MYVTVKDYSAKLCKPCDDVMSIVNEDSPLPHIFVSSIKPNLSEDGSICNKNDETNYKVNISSIMDDLGKVYDEMTIVTSKLHSIVSDLEYSFHEEDFYMVAKRWEELTNERLTLIKKITQDNDISNMTEYIKQLHILSTLNRERKQILDNMTTAISIPYKKREDTYKAEIESLKDQNRIATSEIVRLKGLISDSSILATNYARTKDDEITFLRDKYYKLETKYNEIVAKYSTNNIQSSQINSDVDELRNRLDDLVRIYSSS